MTREIKFQCFPGINTGERVVTARPLLRRRRCSETHLGLGLSSPDPTHSHPLTFQNALVFICIAYAMCSVLT